MRWKSLLRSDRRVRPDLARGRRQGGGLSYLSARSGWISLILLTALLAGCTGGSGSRSRDPSPRRSSAILRPLSVYEQLGLVAGTDEFPAVASFSTLAGPPDSTYVIFGLSLPNSALMFQREGTSGFVGRYGVSLTFYRDGEVVRRVAGEEEVRVPTFAETTRTDESVVYQTLVALEPGEYTVEVEARDLSVLQKRIRRSDALVVPAYRDGGRRLAGPFFVYRADGRESSSETPGLILNPRHTVPYGSESLQVYIEGYGIPSDESVRVRVIGPDDEDLWNTEVQLSSGEGEVSHLVIDLPGEVLPLGRLWVEAIIGDAEAPVGDRIPLVVTVSDQWMVANFDEMLEFLSYIARPAELDSLRNATPSERAQLWDRFWERRDPRSEVGINAFRDNFFERLRLATLYFSEPGRPGWKTERGEVYIVLGPPNYVIDRYINRDLARPDAYDWVYDDGPTGRLVLTFIDRYNLDRFELTPASKVAFRAAANALRSRYR